MRSLPCRACGDALAALHVLRSHASFITLQLMPSPLQHLDTHTHKMLHRKPASTGQEHWPCAMCGLHPATRSYSKP